METLYHSLIPMEKLYHSLCLGLIFAILVEWIGLAYQINPVLQRLLSVVCLLALPQLPIQGLSLAAYFAGVFSGLSLTTGLLLAVYFVQLSRKKQREFFPFTGWIILASTFIFVYPWSLGSWTPIDPYAWGYNTVGIPAMYLCIALGLYLYDRRFLKIWFVIWIGVVGYLLKVPQGDNYWDYLLDPFLGFYAIGKMIAYGVNKGCAFLFK